MDKTYYIMHANFVLRHADCLVCARACIKLLFEHCSTSFCAN